MCILNNVIHFYDFQHLTTPKSVSIVQISLQCFWPMYWAGNIPSAVQRSFDPLWKLEIHHPCTLPLTCLFVISLEDLVSVNCCTTHPSHPKQKLESHPRHIHLSHSWRAINCQSCWPPNLSPIQQLQRESGGLSHLPQVAELKCGGRDRSYSIKNNLWGLFVITRRERC